MLTLDQITQQIESKICSRCGVEKDIAEFYKSRGATKLGIRPECKLCTKRIQKTRDQDPQRKAQKLAASKRFNERNPRAATEATLRWQKNHPDRNRAGSARYKARKMEATIETVDYEQILIRDKGICQICSIPVSDDSWPHPMAKSFDHIVPLSKGGDHSYANVQLAHWHCNLSKKDKL